MSWGEFWVVLVVCGLTMLACRVLPLFLLKGRELPPTLSRALGFIPPAAFAALVANDLLTPGMLSAGHVKHLTFLVIVTSPLAGGSYVFRIRNTARAHPWYPVLRNFNS